MARIKAFDREGKMIADISTDDLLSAIAKSFELAVSLGCYKPSFSPGTYECVNGKLEVWFD